MRWNSAPRMFSAINSRWVPRAQVRVRPGGRSGRASQVSTPAVSACAQRSFAMCGRRPGGAPQASIASVSARCAWVGVSVRDSASTVTRLVRSAAAMASRYAAGVSVQRRTRVGMGRLVLVWFWWSVIGSGREGYGLAWGVGCARRSGAVPVYSNEMPRFQRVFSADHHPGAGFRFIHQCLGDRRARSPGRRP